MGFLDMRAEIGDLEGGFARASDSLVMILTCPECATGYFVDDGQMRPEGRAVRCAACGARWTAHADPSEQPLHLVSSDEGAAPAARAAADASPDGEVRLTGDDLPRAFRDRAEEGRRMRRAAITGAVWAGVAVVLLAGAGAAAMFRDDVVRAWPKAASAYAAVGLPVNPLGLTIEQVRAEPSLQDGHAALAVFGVIHNVTDHAVAAPPLRISLLDRQGRRVSGQIAMLANSRIPPGETRHFLTAILDPPFSAQDLQVEFAPPGSKGAPANLAAHAPLTGPAFSLRGPAATPAEEAPAEANAVAEPTAANDAATDATPPPAPEPAPPTAVAEAPPPAAHHP